MACCASPAVSSFQVVLPVAGDPYVVGGANDTFGTVSVTVLLDGVDEPLELLPIVQVGTLARTRSVGSPPVPVTLTWSVSFQDGMKVCLLRSAVLLHNHSAADLEISAWHDGGISHLPKLPGATQDDFSDAGATVQPAATAVGVTLSAGATAVAVPFALTGMRALKLRPWPTGGTDGEYMVSQRVELRHNWSALAVCRPMVPGGVNFAVMVQVRGVRCVRVNVCVGDLTVYSLPRTTPSQAVQHKNVWNVHVYPPVRMVNALPRTVHIRYRPRRDRSDESVPVKLQPGKHAPLFEQDGRTGPAVCCTGCWWYGTCPHLTGITVRVTRTRLRSS